VRALHLGPNTNVVFSGIFRLSDDPVLQYELLPGAVDGGASISSAGLRDDEYVTPKPADVFRVLLIGDSIAFGFGVTQSDTLSAQLAGLLNGARASVGAHERFEVLNLGVPGYNIEQIVENARVRGLPFQPDAIVYAYSLNDPQAYSFELASLKQQLAATGVDPNHSRRSLAEHSQLVLLARSALRALGPRPPAVSDAEWAALRSGDYGRYFEQLYREPKATARLQRGIEVLGRLAQRANAALTVAIFPLFQDLDAYRLSALHADASTRLRARGIATLDLLSLYEAAQRAYGPLFVFNALHPNAIGDRLAALYLLRALAQGGQLGDDMRRLDLDSLTAGSKVDHAFVQLIERTYGGAAR
jgi:hypothetical protein